MIVAMAAFEAGVISPDQTVFCRGFTTLGNARFHCWKRRGHGHMNMHSGMQQSCDVYFYEIAKRTGVDRIADMARRFGLGEETGIDLPSEHAGLIPTRAWKKAAVGVSWQKGETLITGIGQGFVLTTPLQLAVMTARLATGNAITPHLVRAIRSGNVVKPVLREPPPPIKVGAEALRIVTAGMNAVTNSRRGTAYRARIKEDGMAMAGKTGTAQVRRISKAERATRVLKNHERPWKDRDHALFVAFAPVDKPRYAVAVVVEHGGGGSKVAAPIARDLLIEVQKRDPTGESERNWIAAAAVPKVRA